MKKRYLIVFLLCAFTTSCTLYRKPVTPEPYQANDFKYAIKITNDKLKNNWWENFNDPELNRLVAIALKNNYNYLVTLKNIEIARTYVTQYQSNRFPQISATFNASRNRSISLFSPNNFVTSSDTSIANNTGISQLGRTFSLDEVFGTVTYEIDVWNQIGNAINQAKADTASSGANSNVTKLTLISSVADTYFQIAFLNAEITNLEQQYQAAVALAQLTRAQYHGKLIDVTALSDANNQIESIKINMTAVKKQKEIAMNTLAYLLGETPEQFSLSDIHPNLHIPYSELIPAGLPSTMVANRPDIQAAYFQVLSTGYVEKQNIANFLPSFNLTGNYGYANSNFGTLFTENNSFWNYGINVMQTIFDYKLRMSEYKRAKYQYEAAILNYKNTVINAYQEVDNALLSYQRDHEALLAYQHEVKNSQTKLNVAQTQFQSGYSDYTSYLNNKLILLADRLNLTNQQLLVSEDVIQVYKTLGLGL